MNRYRDFDNLRDELISEGKRFDKNSLKLLSYKDLTMAGIGNALDAACDYELVEEEQKRRMGSIVDFTFEEVEKDKGKWEILDDMPMYWAYYKMKAEAIKMSEAPKWRLLVEAMTDLRGNWGGGRKSKFLKMIYELLPEVEKEGIVPAGWCKAVKMNADTFDGNFNDGRIMRDGHLRLPKDIAKEFGFPDTNASGNIAKLLGATVEIREGGYKGSYTELFEEILTPEQKVIYLSELKDEER